MDVPVLSMLLNLCICSPAPEYPGSSTVHFDAGRQYEESLCCVHFRGMEWKINAFWPLFGCDWHSGASARSAILISYSPVKKNIFLEDPESTRKPQKLSGSEKYVCNAVHMGFT